MYSPSTGRFLSRDPLLDEGGPELLYGHDYVAERMRNVNPYVYCYNNPLAWVDPSGLQPENDFTDWWDRLRDECANIPRAIAIKLCCDWARKEAEDLTWQQGLPSCPCFLETATSKKGRKTWGKPVETPTHGGMRCIRSKTKLWDFPTPPAQQCCYDLKGKLITNGPNAGTPDKVALTGGDFGLGHTTADLLPYLQCERAGLLDAYLHVRRPNNGNQCDDNPPNPVPPQSLDMLCPPPDKNM